MDLQEAYANLGITDVSIDDGNLFNAYYHLTKSLYPESLSFGILPNQAHIDSLRKIASSRNSRWLNFASHLPLHLDDQTVALLADDPAAASSPETLGGDAANGPNHLNNKETVDLVGSDTERNSTHSLEDSTARDNSSSTISIPNYSDEDSNFVEDTDPDAGYESDGEICDFDSEFSNFFDEQRWWCGTCDNELVEGLCPDGHRARCGICGWKLLDNECPKCSLCESCDREKIDGICTWCSSDNASAKEEGEEEQDFLVFDERDQIWRCAYCQWEVEADDETTVYCQCDIDANLASNGAVSSDIQSRPKELRQLHQFNFSDYGPADSDSSVSDSSESDPDSEDERFIDDEDIDSEGMPGVTVGTASNTIILDEILSEPLVPLAPIEVTTSSRPENPNSDVVGT